MALNHQDACWLVDQLFQMNGDYANERAFGGQLAYTLGETQKQLQKIKRALESANREATQGWALLERVRTAMAIPDMEWSADDGDGRIDTWVDSASTEQVVEALEKLLTDPMVLIPLLRLRAGFWK